MNRFGYWCACFTLSLLVVGCGSSDANPLTTLPQARISPSTVFNESTKLLAPHLGLSLSAVQIEYAGPSQWIWSGYEIWQDGEIIRPINWTSGSVMSLPFSGKLTISLKDVSEYTNTSYMRIIIALVSEVANDSGYSSISTYIPKSPDLENGLRSPIELPEPVMASDGEEVAVWGYMVNKDSVNFTNDEAIIDVARQAEWAIVFKIRIGEGDSAL